MLGCMVVLYVRLYGYVVCYVVWLCCVLGCMVVLYVRLYVRLYGCAVC